MTIEINFKFVRHVGDREAGNQYCEKQQTNPDCDTS